jgi:hypothetical protein
MRLHEEEGDSIWRHDELGRFFDGGLAGAVKDCNDDNQCNGVGSGKLGRFAVFGDMAERIRGSDGDSGARAVLSVSSSSLISIAEGRWFTRRII